MSKSDREHITSIKIKIKLLPGGKAPIRATEKSAGFDIFANIEKPIILHPGERALIPAGFSIELPVGYEAQIRPRSGLAIKNGLGLLNSPGTIDSDYRGEIMIIAINLGNSPIEICPGDRIAQMVISQVPQVELVAVENLSPSNRQSGGFGSTGLK